MCRKLIYLVSFVLVLALAGTNVAFGQVVWEGRIEDGMDAVEQSASGGGVDLGSSDLEFMDDGGIQTIGLRFVKVFVPPGANITNAYVEFTRDSSDPATPVHIIIHGELTPNAPAFTSTPFDVSDRPKTTAVAKWSPEPWPVGGQQHQTSDISAVIEEIVGQPGWASGNALVLIFDQDPDNPSQSVRTADTGGMPTAPLLHIEYVTAIPHATQPSPADEATDVPRDVVLSWKPGTYASPVNGHTVYFGESFDDVNEGIGGVTQSAASYTPAQRLDFSKTYYWRVDEVNGPPDFTIYKGGVWSFTTELFSYPIENITATASSQFNADTGPEKTINGLGLDDNDLHSKEEADIWVSSMTGPQPTWIQYEFDRVYKLHQMWVWNHNTSIEPVLGFGIKDATIEYSSDGANWATLGTVEFARASGAAGYAYNTTVDLSSVPAKYVKITANSNWAGILPQYGLSEVRFFHVPVVAREPAPASGATDADVDGVLSWRAGREAASHNLYFSADEQAVIDETIFDSPVSIPADRSYANYATGPLVLGQSYYWKVNEVNEAETPTTWQGDVWNFSAQEYLVVDDFEGYTDFEPDRIFDTWIDGWGVPANGSQVGSDVPPFAEQTIVHSGRQSMPLHYDNTSGATYSEAECTFAATQNWAEHGVKTLSLWFSGAADNVAGQMYVKANGSKVTYDGDASNLTRAGWQVWNIELASFGMNLQRVTTLSIGIDGNGASGTLYIDDIRLYPFSREFITPTEPSSAGLIGHWKFDGETQDSSGRGNHGTAGVTPAAFVAGKVGSNALDLRGADYVVIDGVVDDITSTDITLSIWLKTTQAGEGEVFAANDSASAHPFMLGIQGGNPYVNDGGDTRFPPAINDGQWHLLTYVRSGSTGYVYVDGLLRGTYVAGFSLASVTRWSTGQEWDGSTPSDFYTGSVDDVRFYNRPLSQEEVAWLSGRTTPFDKPF